MVLETSTRYTKDLLFKECGTLLCKKTICYDCCNTQYTIHNTHKQNIAQIVLSEILDMMY